MSTTALGYFTRSCAQWPDKIAVSCDDEEITYRDLDHLSSAVAHHLVQCGLRRGGYVPFYMNKSVASIVCMLAILKADCAYVPLDRNSPHSRLRSILTTLGAEFLLTSAESTKDGLKLTTELNEVTVVDVDSLDTDRNVRLDSQNISLDIAYVLFTSGSTGTPKGVMVPHRAIVDYIDWCVDYYDVSDMDNISNHAPLYFDNSTFDIYTAFASGATLHLVPEYLNAVIPKLVSWLEGNAISVFFCVPSVLTLLLRSRRLKPGRLDKLRHLVFAGEVVLPSVLRDWMQIYPHILYTNMYGPTEITVDCTYYRVENPPELDGSSVPIGYVRPNMEAFIRTDDGSIVDSKSSEGELLVRGTSVTYGYLGDEQKTALSFIQNPRVSYYDPLYCTGDLVRVDANGLIEFMGRADDQVKYLGYRIELGEIEISLCNIEGVEECAVVFNNADNQDEQEIGAIVNLASGIERENVRQRLATLVPEYMVPTRWVVFDQEFPRTPNGKHNRTVLKNLVFEK